MGMWAMHLGRNKTFSKRLGREYRGRRGLGKRERDLQRGLGARQEETLRGNSSGRCYEGEVEAVIRAM